MLVSCPSLPFIFDLLKTLIGAFLGALFAFLVSMSLEYFKRKKEYLANGNLAMMVLSRQYGDFLIAKTFIEIHIANLLRAYPNTPSWAQLQPTLFKFSETLRVNLQSLAFLLEGHSEIVDRLVNVDVKYHDLGDILDTFTEAAYKRHQIFSEHGVTEVTPVDYREAQNWMGIALIGKLESLMDAIDIRLKNDLIAYQKAGQTFNQIMVKRFGINGVVPFQPLGANMEKINNDRQLAGLDAIAALP